MRISKPCACGKPRAKSQNACLECRSEYQREHRAAHPEYRRNWAKEHPLEGEARKKDIARSTVSVYVRRGKLAKTPCPCCGSLEVKARIQDYDNPLSSVEWLCAESHAFAVRTGRMPMRRAA